jgi:hypothetical protein
LPLPFTILTVLANRLLEGGDLLVEDEEFCLVRFELQVALELRLLAPLINFKLKFADPLP